MFLEVYHILDHEIFIIFLYLYLIDVRIFFYIVIEIFYSIILDLFWFILDLEIYRRRMDT